jgi:predicted secreted Zn-dependent protease
MKATLAGLLLLGLIVPAGAAELSKSYSYFSIRGATLDDIERDLSRRGPSVATTGQRHPGATRMEFKTHLTYANHGRYCRISSAQVRITAKVILPRWRRNRRASADTRFVWDTLAIDIKRHEEQHVAIANSYARDLESALTRLGRSKDCKTLEAKAAKTTTRILDKHDRAQQRFDQVESKGFEKRLIRLMEKRLKEAKAG